MPVDLNKKIADALDDLKPSRLTVFDAVANLYPRIKSAEFRGVTRKEIAAQLVANGVEIKEQTLSKYVARIERVVPDIEGEVTAERVRAAEAHIKMEN